jgi:V-type H+-transporting ATPase subunit H
MLVSNAHLDDHSTKIRNKNVPWDVRLSSPLPPQRPLTSPQAYQRADLITVEELGLIKKVDRQPRTRVESILLSEGSTYAYLYLGLLKKVNRTDTQQCLLVWITDALAGTPAPPARALSRPLIVPQTTRNAYPYSPIRPRQTQSSPTYP